jgi:hypothetical protein
MQLALQRSGMKVFFLYYLFLPIGLFFVFIIPFLWYPLSLFLLFVGFAFLCIGIHELSHLVVAKSKGYETTRPMAKWYALGFQIQPSPKREDATAIYLVSLITCFIIPPIVLYLFGIFWGMIWFLGTFSMSFFDIINWRKCVSK